MSEKTYLIKSTINNILNLISSEADNDSDFMSDMELAKLLKVSRTTIIEAISYLCDEQIIKRKRSGKTILRLPQSSDYFDIENCEPSKESQIQTFFLNLIMSGELKPGDRFYELDLSRKSGCTTITVREFLNKFSNNGLIVKNPRSGWRIVELDEELIYELIEFRRMVEMSSINKLMKLSNDDPIWESFQDILIQHQEMRGHFDERHEEFHTLTRRYQSALQAATQNRFTNKFSDSVLFIIHYYFLWNEGEKRESIRTATEQRIELLTYLLTRDFINVFQVLEKHLNTTRKELLGCIKNIERATAA